MLIRHGLGDIERKWQIEAEAPIRFAEIAQGVANGLIPVEGDDTPENRALIANQYLDLATNKANELITLAQTGIKYSADAPATDPSGDYQWMPGTTPSIQQAIAEIQYARPIVAEIVAPLQNTAPEIFAQIQQQPPAVLATEQAQQAIIQQQQQAIIQQQQQAIIQQQQQAQQAQQAAIQQTITQYDADFQRRLNEQNAAFAAQLAEQQRAQAAQQAAALEAQLAAQRAALAAAQQKAQTATTQTDYDKAYNAAVAAQQAIKDLNNQTPGESYLSSTGGGATMYPQGFKPVTDDGSANYALWAMLGIGAFILLKKK